jgi:hypothetical protein
MDGRGVGTRGVDPAAVGEALAVDPTAVNEDPTVDLTVVGNATVV